MRILLESIIILEGFLFILLFVLVFLGEFVQVYVFKFVLLPLLIILLEHNATKSFGA